MNDLWIANLSSKCSKYYLEMWSNNFRPAANLKTVRELEFTLLDVGKKSF